MKVFRNSCLIILALLTANSFAQTTEESTATMLNKQSYIFVATSAVPSNVQDLNKVMSKMQGGAQSGFINLNGDGYELIVTSDSVVAYLPYYGRAYSAPMNQSGGGVKFTSKQFVYKKSQRKKGNWDVTITTKDVFESYRLSLNIAVNGNASLYLHSNNKQTITYNGYLKPMIDAKN